MLYKLILKFTRLDPKFDLNIRDTQGIKCLTRLRLGLMYLNYHRFVKHNIQDCRNPICNLSHDIETTTHFFLHCHFCKTMRNESFVTKALLSGNKSLNPCINKSMRVKMVKK